jgi:hypothetical protein
MTPHEKRPRIIAYRVASSRQCPQPFFQLGPKGLRDADIWRPTSTARSGHLTSCRDGPGPCRGWRRELRSESDPCFAPRGRGKADRGDDYKRQYQSLHGAPRRSAWATGLAAVISNAGREQETVKAVPPASVNLVPVKCSMDRIIRSTVGLRPSRKSGFRLAAERLDDKTVMFRAASQRRSAASDQERTIDAISFLA